MSSLQSPKGESPGLVGFVGANRCSILKQESSSYALYNTVPRQTSKGPFWHIHRRDSLEETSGHFFTSGPFDVWKLLHVSESHLSVFFTFSPYDSKRLNSFTFCFSRYFLAPREGQPGTRHGFSLDKDTERKTCLTCDVDPGCDFFDAEICLDAKLVRWDCEGPDVPKTFLTLLAPQKLTSDGQFVKLTADDSLLTTLNNLKLARREFFTVESQFF